jgi:hypothetical protein
VKADLNLPFQGREAPFQNLVEVDDFPVGVVDDFNLGRFLGKKYRGPSAKRLTIDLMFRDHTQNPGSKLLLAPVIRKRRSHFHENTSCNYGLNLEAGLPIIELPGVHGHG